ncbi:MAG TPA: CarD family transcriptional regulator [Pyrinomonadaceae bacterium]|nr:CarD family transcriptional regulator [Pyrinomonadaceae bacterium]
MELSVGQKVAYPNQGVCLVEDIERKKIGERLMQFYALRVLSDNSMILVPTGNAEAVGIRPVITTTQYRRLINKLAADFELISSDWKERSREFHDKLQSGDVFEAADVLKKLTFLSYEKKLSFREQTFLEKARYLIVSEVITAGLAKETLIENKINQLIENACHKHLVTQPSVTAVH